MSIGKYARELIIANPAMKNEEIVAKVKAKFPEAKTSLACIAWYRSDLKKKKVEAVRTIASVSQELKDLLELHAKLKEELATLIEEENIRKMVEEEEKKREAEALEESKALLEEEIAE